MNGKKALLEDVVKRHRREIEKVAEWHFRGERNAKDLADDAVAEGLLRALEGIEGFDSGKGSLLSWVKNIVANSCIDIHRDRKICPNWEDGDLGNNDDGDVIHPWDRRELAWGGGEDDDDDDDGGCKWDLEDLRHAVKAEEDYRGMSDPPPGCCRELASVSDRELLALKYLSRGMSREKIAKEMGVTRGAVDALVSRIQKRSV